ncbi:MAG: hypothetical protein WB424_18605 [Terracidiphilus sp.]|jgi:hypothetical protein
MAKAATSMVISMRLPTASAKRLRRLANRYGWTPSDASARLVEEGLRRSEFAFIDFRDTPAGRQACIQASSLAVWEVIQIVRSYKGDEAAAAKHLGWAQVKVQAAVHYAEAFLSEINEAIADNQATDLVALKQFLPQTVEFLPKKPASR